ncbi:MAG TPA: glycosyltransferase [Gaiellaceae bacterium]|nr:glycosyltransferase [Gaiellaceae bacterium]
MPTLTAIVPATDRPATLGRCLSAIRAALEPPEEIVVIEEPPGGPAAARNEGARRAGGEVLVFVDSDVEVHDDAFVRIRRAFDADPELTALFGAYDDDPAERDPVSSFRNLLHHHVHTLGKGPATTFWAGLGAVRREEFFTAGGFDAARYPWPSIEDIELGARLTERDGRIVLDPAVSGKHLKRWTLLGYLRTDLLRRGIPWVELLLETRSSTTALNLGWPHRLSSLLSVAAIVASLQGRPRGAIVATSGLVALNGSFYALVWRRRGPATALAAVPLHALHHAAGALAAPLGVGAHMLRRRRRR